VTNEGHVYRHRVPPEAAGRELLAYHVARFPHSDRAAWQRSIHEGRVRRNGRAAGAEERLVAGDELEFHRPPWREPEAPLSFGVVLEDEVLLVLEKPAGLQVLPGGPFHARTLLHLARASSPERAQCAPVHRLGRGTSGLILLGKSAGARAELSRQLRSGGVRRTYLARVQGCGLPPSSVARQPIGPVELGPWTVPGVSAAGRAAETRLRVLERRPERGETLVAAQPISGRANQIRIHLAAAGAPLVGEPLYGSDGLPRSTACSAEGGYLLHAAGLGFRHPATGRWLRLRSRPGWLA